MLDLTSQWYGDLQLVACPVGMEPFNDHSSSNVRLSDSTQKQGAAKQPGVLIPSVGVTRYVIYITIL